MPFSLEDPLQHTNLGIGGIATYRHTSVYKLQMNYRNLEALRDDTVNGIFNHTFILPYIIMYYLSLLMNVHDASIDIILCEVYL